MAVANSSMGAADTSNSRTREVNTSYVISTITEMEGSETEAGQALWLAHNQQVHWPRASHAGRQHEIQKTNFYYRDNSTGRAGSGSTGKRSGAVHHDV